jgi:glutamyl-tRNA synthetase
MNGQYLSLVPVQELVEPVARELGRLGMAVEPGPALEPYIHAVKARSRTLLDVARQVAVRRDPASAELDDKGRALIDKLGEGYRRNLGFARESLGGLGQDEWKSEPILAALKATVEREQLKLGDLLQPIRVALTGSTVSEPVNELLEVVGRTAALSRLAQAAAG